MPEQLTYPIHRACYMCKLLSATLPFLEEWSLFLLLAVLVELAYEHCVVLSSAVLLDLFQTRLHQQRKDVNSTGC